MNNFKFFISIIFFSFLSCRENKINNQADSNPILIDSELTIKKSLTIIKAKVEKQVLPDTTVNNKLMLSNDKSLKTFYLNEVKTLERIRESPVVVFINKDNNEYLIAYQYEGGIKNSYDCFEIGYLKNEQELNKVNNYKTSEESFITETNIGLGTSLEKLKSIKGANYEKTERDNIIILTYRNADFENSSFLKRYNMPSYFMEFTLRENKIEKIKFGFDYP